MSQREIGPVDVARVLDAAKVKYVLVGAHATNGYTGRPRATVDVDLIVQFPKKASQAIARAFPRLRMKDTPVVIRFIDGDQEAIDLLKPNTSKLWPALMKHALSLVVDGYTVRVPSVEGVLAAKFSAMVSIGRRLADKMIDGGDFIRVVEANPTLDAELLERFGDLVYPGGGKEILKLVADARAGRRLEF
jgi:hypothetical protein